MRQIAAQIEGRKTEYDITRSAPGAEVTMGDGDLLVVGMPVYSGRIPASALPALRKFRGNGTPAVVVCVYGNRDYDDALLELTDVVGENGFRVAAAAAFVAAHSIFPQVGTNRPDEEDIYGESPHSFGSSVGKSILRPIPPLCRKSCLRAAVLIKRRGKCRCDRRAAASARGAAYASNDAPYRPFLPAVPRQTDPQKCIACGRCIVVCPARARRFGGLLYKIVRRKFVKAYSVRKEPDIYV